MSLVDRKLVSSEEMNVEIRTVFGRPNKDFITARGMLINLNRDEKSEKFSEGLKQRDSLLTVSSRDKQIMLYGPLEEDEIYEFPGREEVILESGLIAYSPSLEVRRGRASNDFLLGLMNTAIEYSESHDKREYGLKLHDFVGRFLDLKGPELIHVLQGGFDRALIGPVLERKLYRPKEH